MKKRILSEEHKKKISESLKKAYAQGSRGTNKGKITIDKNIVSIDISSLITPST
jgi:hypothetical protein